MFNRLKILTAQVKSQSVNSIALFVFAAVMLATVLL